MKSTYLIIHYIDSTSIVSMASYPVYEYHHYYYMLRQRSVVITIWAVSSEKVPEIWPRGYKTFFMLNSAEHEIFSAYKYENANNSWHFHIY